MLFLIICFELSACLYFFENSTSTESFLASKWKEYSDETKEGLQEQFHCCGWDALTPGVNCPE